MDNELYNLYNKYPYKIDPNYMHKALKTCIGTNQLDNASVTLLAKMWIDKKLGEIICSKNKYFIRCWNNKLQPFNIIFDGYKLRHELNIRDYPHKYELFQDVLYSLLNAQNEAVGTDSSCVCNLHNEGKCRMCNQSEKMFININDQSYLIRYLFEKVNGLQLEINVMQNKINSSLSESESESESQSRTSSTESLYN